MNLTEAFVARWPQLTPSRTDWQAIRCPLHDDSSASAGLNFYTKMFKCHAGCGTLTFPKLAQKLEIVFDGIDDGLMESVDWLQMLGAEPEPPKRTLRQQAVEYTNFLLEKGIKPETIEEFGGYYEANQASNDYGYLILPYGKDKKERRRVIRSVGDNRFEQRSGTSKNLFGRNISAYNSIIIVEGITDYFALWQRGFTNSCATFGAEVSKQQMYVLRGKTVFILFDRDYAGYEGANKAVKLLKKFGANPIVLEIPKHFGDSDDKIDPNSAMLRDPMGFSSWLSEQITRYSLFDTDYINDLFLANKKTVKYIPTKIPGLDAALNGGLATGLHAFAGMPEAGKSTFVAYIEDTFTDMGYKVLSLSYELTKEQKYARLASIRSRHSWSDIEKDHSILEQEANEYLRSISENLRIDNNWSIAEVKAAAANFDVIIVDYAQRMPFDGEDERAGIKGNCRELSNLTRDGKIIVLISSIPRSQYNKIDSKAIYKETGDIEYICQSGYLLSKITNNIACLKMIKNTRGACKDIYLEMDYAHQRITETTRPEIGELMQ